MSCLKSKTKEGLYISRVYYKDQVNIYSLATTWIIDYPDELKEYLINLSRDSSIKVISEYEVGKSSCNWKHLKDINQNGVLKGWIEECQDCAEPQIFPPHPIIEYIPTEGLQLGEDTFSDTYPETEIILTTLFSIFGLSLLIFSIIYCIVRKRRTRPNHEIIEEN